MRAVVRLGERAARKVTADGTVTLASPACTYTCTPSLIFLSFRCSNTPFKSSPFVGSLGSFCPNIYASLQNSVLSAYVVIFFFFFKPDVSFSYVIKRSGFVFKPPLGHQSHLARFITKGIPPPTPPRRPSSKRLDGYKSSDHGLNLFRVHGISLQGNLLYYLFSFG